MVCAVCLSIFLWHPSWNVQCPCGHYSPQPETHNGLSILFIITTNSDNAYVHILGVFILEIMLTTLAPSQARNISRRPLFVRRRQNKKGWHWYLLIKPEPKIVALVSAGEARARNVCTGKCGRRQNMKQRSWYVWVKPGPRFNIKMMSYQYSKSHCGDKTVVRSSYLHNGISYIGKISSLYWFGAQDRKEWHWYPWMKQ